MILRAARSIRWIETGSAEPFSADCEMEFGILGVRIPVDWIFELEKFLGLRTLDQQKWETDEGFQRSSFQLIANTIEFIKTDGRGFDNDHNDEDIPI